MESPVLLGMLLETCPLYLLFSLRSVKCLSELCDKPVPASTNMLVDQNNPYIFALLRVSVECIFYR